MIWFGLVLRHINHCCLFNAKFSLYIYIKYTSFGLVGFLAYKTTVGYLMLNPHYTCTLAWFGLGLWHSNHCCLFNAKSSLYIRGAFNKFPDFFVQAFKITVNTRKFAMLLLYILSDD